MAEHAYNKQNFNFIHWCGHYIVIFIVIFRSVNGPEDLIQIYSLLIMLLQKSRYCMFDAMFIGVNKYASLF